jgi:hypothetical protein
MPIQSHRGLYRSAELPALHQLSDEARFWFVETGQLKLVLVAGKVRYSKRELNALMAKYFPQFKRKRPTAMNAVQVLSPTNKMPRTE